MHTRRPRLTYANIVSTIALMIAMSTGGAYAAGLITASDIADGAVTAPKIREGAVRNVKLAEDSVTRAKVAAGAVDTEQLAAGAVTSGKVAANAVNSARVVDGSLTTDDVADQSLAGGDIQDSTIGPDDLSIWTKRPPAFAFVRFDGVLPNQSSGLTEDMVDRAMDGENPIVGVHCFHDLPFAPQAISATSSYSPPTVVGVYLGASSDCPAGTQVTVTTQQQVAGNWQLVEANYYVNLWP